MTTASQISTRTPPASSSSYAHTNNDTIDRHTGTKQAMIRSTFLLLVALVALATLASTASAFVIPAPAAARRQLTTRVWAEEGEQAGEAAAAPAAEEGKKKDGFKGFGERPKKQAPPPKTKAQLEREKYASAYDSLAAKGVPEYAVYIREASSQSDKDWKFVGSMAVPRNAKIDAAIYDNEQNLVKGAFKLHPRLVGKEPEGFTYGYNLKKFPDEPIKVAVKPSGEGKNPIAQWFENVLNPLDASNIKQP